MRYLFGDSAPFPLGYNFLATLEAFMTASTRIVQLDLESKGFMRAAEETAQNRVKALEALEQFHTVVMRAVQDAAQKVQHPQALDYAQRVADFASGYVDENKRGALANNERETMALRNENDRRMVDQRGTLDVFLKVARLPVLSTRVSMRSETTGKDTRHTLTATFDNSDGIATSFALDTNKVPAWTQPRRVADFAQGVELTIGIDKSWLRGTVTPKVINVDEWIVAQFELADDACDLVLRKRAGERESLTFHLRRTEAGAVLGSVEHPEIPAQLPAGDVASLDRVWQALRLAVREVLEHKESLLSVSLDGQPVFETGLCVPFVVRLVAMFAPTVREIAKRSPNEFELSLKTESEGGRREEIYLRKEALTQKLQPLSAAGREVFAPLGLDSWVPGVTSAPPPVVAPSGSNRTLPQS